VTILARTLLSLAALAPLSSGQERAAATAVVEAPFVPATALVLDGDGAEWRGERAPDIVIERPDQLVSLDGRAPGALWRGPADASVRVWFGWNASDLFLCGEVRDDLEQHDAQRWYEGDCIELYLSTADVVAQWGTDDWQVMLAPSWSERPWGVYPRAGQPGRPDGGFGGVEVAAQELAELGVRANVIAPSGRTRMVEASDFVLAQMPKREGFDRHLPEHIAPLIVYLASPLCRFTGRVFGIEGGDVVLFAPWDGEHLVSNGEATWTAEGLAAALDPLPAQASTRAFFPGGRLDTVSPPHRTLKALAAVPRDS